MRTVAVVQARMSSTRLPGKVLRPLAGTPLLGWVIEGLRHARTLDDIVVATSDEPEDDPVATFAASCGVLSSRGPLQDVAGRMLATAEAVDAEVVVRVCADSPLLLADVVDAVVRLHHDRLPDLATNVFPRSFPQGQSVEAFAPALLRRAHARMDRTQREHVTRWFYDHAHELEIANLTGERDLSHLRHGVDTPEDAERVERLLRSVDLRPWDAGLPRLAELSGDVG